jgi:hypothetical protein
MARVTKLEASLSLPTHAVLSTFWPAYVNQPRKVVIGEVYQLVTANHHYAN